MSYRAFLVTEDAPLKPSSPYARTKLMMEMILRDLCAATPTRAIALRYFNPIGADPKMRSGVHVAQPSHVLGRMVAASRGEIPEFTITGTDWPTRDGTGIRDYIHVWDLAQAHIQAVERFDQALDRSADPTYLVVNLGTGTRCHGARARGRVPACDRPPPADTRGSGAARRRGGRLCER